MVFDSTNNGISIIGINSTPKHFYGPERYFLRYAFSSIKFRQGIRTR